MMIVWKRLFVECPEAAVVVPEGNDSSVEEITVNTETMLVTLTTALDYEVETFYAIILQVIDVNKVPVLTGQVTLKVRPVFH